MPPTRATDSLVMPVRIYTQVKDEGDLNDIDDIEAPDVVNAQQKKPAAADRLTVGAARV